MRTRSAFAIRGAQIAPYAKSTGALGLTDPNSIDTSIDNNYALRALSATGTTQLSDVELFRLDANDNIQLGRSVFTPLLTTKTFNLATNGSLATQAFWIADAAYTITGIQEIHATAGTNGSAVTGAIYKSTGTQAPTEGVTTQVGTFDLKGTASTLQTATLSATQSSLAVAQGDRLCFVISGTATAVAGVTITIQMAPGNRAETAEYAMALNADIATTAFFTATRPMIVTAVYAVHSTAGTNGSAVTGTITKDTSTNAPGAGTALLTTALSLKAAINTVQTGVLSATAATLRLAPGDRLSFKTSGTLTAVAGVVFVVVMRPLMNTKMARYTLAANANLVSQTFFIADRGYKVTDIAQAQATAGTDGGAVTIDVTIDKLTDAPGAGVSVLASTLNAKGTANTVQNGSLATIKGTAYMLAGDRLSVKYTGTLTALAGVQLSAQLEAA